MAQFSSTASLSNNTLRQLSSPLAIRRASQNSDDTLAGAKSIGVLSAIGSKSFNFKGKLSRTDRNDFVQLELSPGAAFSSISNVVKIKGAGVRLISFFEIPGSAPQQASTLQFGVGKSSQVTNAPFSNSFGVPLKLYLQVNSQSRSKQVRYNFRLTFNP